MLSTNAFSDRLEAHLMGMAAKYPESRLSHLLAMLIIVTASQHSRFFFF